ncbi:MAG: BON domain-containing protein [Leptospirillia bacterium]
MEWTLLAAPLLCLLLSGCPAALVVGGVGGYAVASDERSVGRQASDALITSRVKARLLADERVHAFRIDVDTLEGVVTLSGKLSSADEAARAAKIARETEGVLKVISRLTH